MTPAEVIRAARNVLFARGWHQGDMLGPDGSVCLEGALCIAEGQRLAQDTIDIVAPGYDVWELVLETIPEPLSPSVWNDAPERTFGDIIDALDRAEKLAEDRESA